MKVKGFVRGKSKEMTLLDVQTDLDVFNEDDFFIPFFSYFVSKLKKRINRELNMVSNEMLQKQTILGSILRNYKDKIVEISSKVIIYEFHQTFDKYDAFDNSKYYHIFNDRLTETDYIQNILLKYPVLKQLIDSIEENYLFNHIKIILSYQADSQLIEKKLGYELGDLVAITIDMGDTHCDGKSVAFVTCEKGEIVYKPRSLTADCIYESILLLFNEKCSTELKAAKTIDNGDYGWQECIKPLPLERKCEGPGFYKELGMHLGFVYMFHGSDFHYENIIANGKHPILIDLETLFQPNLSFQQGAGKNQPKHFLDALNRTVYKSLFLNHTTYPEEANMMSLYALSNVEGQSYDKEKVLNEKTDFLSIKKVSSKMKRGSNLPVYNKEILRIHGFEKDFIEGFEYVYKFFKVNYQKVINEMNGFPDFPVRIVMRPTYIYSCFLESLLHPKYLELSSERERILSFFSDSYREFHAFRELVPHEIEDLYKGDIPYFYSFFQGIELYNSKNEIIDCKLLDKSPIEEIKDRISNLSNKDLTYQINLINMSLSASNTNNDSFVKTEISSQYKNSLLVKDMNDLIIKESEKIYSERLHYGHNVQWISLSISPVGQMVSGPLSYGLYDGLAGIVLYLATYFYYESDEVPYNEITYMKQSIENLVDNSTLKNSFSAFYGLGSYVYYTEKLRELNMITLEDALVIYDDFCNKIVKNLESMQTVDFIGGLAGVLKVLTMLYKRHGLLIIKQTAYLVYQSLIKKSNMQNNDIFWYSDSLEDTALAGFSHGLTGICYALSEYSTISSEEVKFEIANVITKTLHFEDTFFVKSEKNWTDNRNNTNNFSTPFWCHGAAGILLGRVKILQNMGALCEVNYIHDALITTIQQGEDHMQGNSLCHGTMGNIDILNEVKKAPFLVERQDEINHTISNWLTNYTESMTTKGWNNGVKNDFSSVGFMLGKTGQLYTLLRLKNRTIPSVMLLD
ncbi:type 2 lanthipeptide synthetase LanM family protein [Salipaludibacillus sp. HK11]|uniref:type 2 lanthipeptide synthetase LanM family protein n=1 Tax=Salipaludibacillus sp. HK11 TaxID=3394320 RepID=UPI0039FBBA0D